MADQAEPMLAQSESPGFVKWGPGNWGVVVCDLRRRTAMGQQVRRAGQGRSSEGAE